MATLSIKIDDDIKKAAEAEFKAIGLSTSAAVKIYFRKVIQEHGIPFSLKQKMNEVSTDFRSDSSFRALPQNRKVNRYQVKNVNGKLCLPNDFPTELKDAWEL